MKRISIIVDDDIEILTIRTYHRDFPGVETVDVGSDHSLTSVTNGDEFDLRIHSEDQEYLSYPFTFRTLMDGNYICERQKVLKNGLTDYLVIASDRVSVLGHITTQCFEDLLKNEIISWFEKVDDHVKIEIRRYFKLKES